ncbi:MAG TPA: hypothetical protein VIN59_05155 [Alphaproteobacteria bacterium]
MKRQDDVSIVRQVFTAMAADPHVTAYRLWKRHYAHTSVSHDVVDDVLWLVHHDRMQDFSVHVMDIFRQRADARCGLPEERHAMIRRLLNRAAHHEPFHGRMRPVPLDVEQCALLFHLSRLGAGRNAIDEFFKRPIVSPTHVMINQIVRDFYIKNGHGWHWEDTPRDRLVLRALV